MLCIYLGALLLNNIVRVCFTLPGCIVVKNLPANAGDTRDMSSIPGLGRYPRVQNGIYIWKSDSANTRLIIGGNKKPLQNFSEYYNDM